MSNCQTMLCGAPAAYIHTVTKEKKCSRCRFKRGDAHSLAWQLIEDQEVEDGYLNLPLAKPENKYVVLQSSNNKYVIMGEDDEVLFSLEEKETINKVAQALNNAYKLGVCSVLHGLNTFSLDQRRKHGIVWREKHNSINS